MSIDSLIFRETARIHAMSLRRRIFALVVILATTVVLWQGAIRAQSVPASDIRTLMADLSDVKTTRRDTVTRILQVASKDPSAREYVLQKLPEMIEAGTDEPWLNAIRLAGQMKAVEAIPSLMQEMSRRTFPAEPIISGGGLMRLDNDIVAKALSQIGDAAIPSVVTLLKSSEASTRRRAVLILRNIHSNASRKILQDRLPQETNPDIKKLIEDSLHS
jgi:hypothetical protein